MSIRAFKQYLVSGLAAIFVGQLFITSFFAHPAWDDFCLAIRIDEIGWFNHFIEKYIVWTGRFSAMFLQSFLTATFGLLDGYTLFALLTLVFSLFCCSYFFYCLLPNSTRPQALLGGILLLAMYSLFLKGLGSQYFWFTSALSYQLGPMSLLLCISYLAKQSLDYKKLTPYGKVLLFTFCAITCGYSEIATLLLLTGTFIGYAISIITKSETKPVWQVAFFGTLFGSLFAILAPGNLNRKGGGGIDYIKAAKVFLEGWFIYVFLSYPALYLLEKLLPFKNQFNSISTRFKQNFGEQKLFVSYTMLASYFILPALFVLPTAIISGNRGPARTLGILFICLLSLWVPFRAAFEVVLERQTLVPKRLLVFCIPIVFLISAFGLHLSALVLTEWRLATLGLQIMTGLLMLYMLEGFFRLASQLTDEKSVNFFSAKISQLLNHPTILIAVLIFTLSISNFYYLSKDYVNGTAFSFDRTMQTRYEEIATQAEQGNLAVTVPSITYNQRPVFIIGDLKSNPDHWINSCTATYFGIEQLSTN